MYQALYRKYRPQKLEDVCGQDVIVKIIKNSINNNKISHAYLFSGPRGTGKTSIAKIFAKIVNCENSKNGIMCGKCNSCLQQNNTDIIEIDAASNNGVDEIRELRNKVNLVPSYGKYKVYIVDEVHMLTTGAFNALLKTLEEPPNHIIFILATTDPHKIPETILSRCQKFEFKKISNVDIVKRLKEISKKEKIQIDEEALYEIARLSDGGMRDSIGMLDQAISYTEGKIIAKDIHEINGTISIIDLKEFIELITLQKIDIISKKIDNYNEIGKNFVKLTEEIIIFLRNILVYKEAQNYFKEINSNYKIYDEISSGISTKSILYYIEILNETLNNMKLTNNPKLSLELAIIQMMIDEDIKQQNTQKNEFTKNNIVNNSERQEIIKKENKTEKKSSSAKIKKTKEKSINHENLKKLIELRINNTLAKFQKRYVISLNQKLSSLNNYLLDPDYSKYASIILDGTLKAATDDHVIFVYKNNRLSELFNENILKIEELLSKVLNKNYKAIATAQDNWDEIKNEFNSKKKIYKYIDENIKLSDIFIEQVEKSEFTEFEDLIEYN